MKLDIVKCDLDKLTRESEPFNFNDQAIDPRQLATDLVETMYANDGLGLSAIQVDKPVRVFAFRGGDHDFVMFNPRILVPSTETIQLEEGCLSWPGLIVKITRPKHLRIRFAGPDGDINTQTFTGMTARVIQHEMDHLNGLVFWDGVKRYRVEKALKKAKKNGFDYEGMGLLKYAD